MMKAKRKKLTNYFDNTAREFTDVATLWCGHVSGGLLELEPKMLIRPPNDCGPHSAASGEGPTHMKLLKLPYGLSDVPAL